MKIATKLAILFSAIFVLVGLIPSYFYYNGSARQLEASETAQVKNITFNTMDRLDQTFYERYLDIKMIAGDPLIRSGRATPEQISGRLLTYKSGHPSYASLSFFDLNRTRIADTEGTALGVQHAFTEYWPEIMSGKDFTTSLSYSESLKAVTLHFAAVVRNEKGQRMGVAVERVSLDSLDALFKMHIKGYGEKSVSSLELVDGNGHILYSNQHKVDELGVVNHEWLGIKAMLNRGEYSGVIDKSVDEEFLVFAREPGFRDFKGNNWVLIIEMPRENIYAPARKFRNESSALLLGMSALIVPFLFLFSYTITSRIRKLVKVSAEIGRGNLGARINISSRDEIGELSATFDRMSMQLKERHDKLQLAASVFTHVREGILITDGDGDIIDVNQTFTGITGYDREEVIGKNPRILKSGRQGPEFYQAMWKMLQENGHWAGEIWNRRKSGELYAESITISAMRDAEGRTTNYVALMSDITPMKWRQQQLERIAHYDPLTGLPNRLLLSDRLQQAMSQSQRRHQMLAVVYLDLDGFKAINDTYGHHAGDELLIAVTLRMKAALRDGDTLARIGGDEFVAVLVDLELPRDCEPILARLLQAAARPVALDGALLQVSASIGVAIYPQDGSEADLLVLRADEAMYQAKQSGKNRYRLFDADR